MELTKDEVIRRLRVHQPYMSSNYGLKSIGLFGSYATGTPTEESDIDLIVEFDQPIGLKFIEFTEYLENLLEKRLDILTPVGLKSIRNPKIAQTIRENVVYVR